MLSLQRLSLDDARTMIAGAEAKAAEIGVPMCIAVVDESSNLIAFHRMDGGKTHSTFVAINKAYTAASARKATHEIQPVANPGGPLFGIQNQAEGRFCIIGGGLPVMVNGAVVGAIGVSSGTPGQDQEVAQAGVDGLG